MQSTPNRTSKIPRPGAISPRVNQGSKSPQSSMSFQDDKSPQSPLEATSVHKEIPLVSQLMQGIEGCDWEQLQGKYTDAMEEHGRVEENLRVETAKLLEVSSKSTSDLRILIGRFSWIGLKRPLRKMRIEL